MLYYNILRSWNQIWTKKDNGGMTGIMGDAGVDGSAADKTDDNLVFLIICYIITFYGVGAKCGVITKYGQKEAMAA